MTESQPPAREAAPPRLDPNADLAAPEPGGPNPGAPTPSAAPAPTAEPLASVIAKPRSSSGRGTSLLMALAAAIAIGGIAFAAGRLTAPATAATAGRGTGQLAGNGYFPGNANDQGLAGRGNGFGGISVTGTVSAVSGDSITLKEASGTEITIPLSSSTTYHTATTSSADAVTVGSQVSVTPGARTADPNATPDPSASPGSAIGRLSFGPASDVTVIEK